MKQCKQLVVFTQLCGLTEVFPSISSSWCCNLHISHRINDVPSHFSDSAGPIRIHTVNKVNKASPSSSMYIDTSVSIWPPFSGTSPTIIIEQHRFSFSTIPSATGSSQPAAYLSWLLYIVSACFLQHIMHLLMIFLRCFYRALTDLPWVQFFHVGGFC